MFGIEGTPATDLPEYRDFVSAGTYLLGVLIVAMTPVTVALVNRRAKRSAQEVKQALDEHPTSNGFTKDVKETLTKLEKSLGGVHGRLDQITADRDADQRHTDRWMISVDNRLTHIEDKGGCKNEHENDSTQDAPGA